MGVEETLKKYSWILPLIQNVDRTTRSVIMKNFRQKKANFFPKGEFKADVENLIKCMLCPNMCRFDCGTLQASLTETMSPAYKTRIGYYLTTGKIDPMDKENKAFIDLMYKCTNEENCKVWCPFEFSVVSLLETVRDDLNDKGLMPEYCKQQISKLKRTNTIEDHNIYETYKEKGIKNIETKGNDEVFYYIGCESMKFPKVIKANIQILEKAEIKFSTNLDKKVCCGGPAFNIRDLELAKELANKNKELVESTGADIIISDCPGCVLTLKNRYEKVGIKIEKQILHTTQYFRKLIQDRKLILKNKVPEEYKNITIHDPCLIVKNLNDTESIREILKKISNLAIIEPIYNKEYVHCCGWSGTAHWADKDLAVKEARNRINELKETDVNIFVSACPLCELGLAYGIEEFEKEKYKIVDISELLLKLL
ncbi:MAG: (Fe-S)-binding protein [Candidatus Odinarchaeota archaeon]